MPPNKGTGCFNAAGSKPWPLAAKYALQRESAILRSIGADSTRRVYQRKVKMGAQVSVRSSNRCQRVTWGKRRRTTASISFQRNVWEFSCQSQDESRKSRSISRGYVLERESHV